MTTYQQDSFLSEILEGEKIPLGKLAYFRERLRNRLYDLVINEFLKQEKTKNLTRADVARRIGRRREQVTRWFGAPGNWTIDTVSDLMLAMGTEPNFSIGSLREEEKMHSTDENVQAEIKWDIRGEKMNFHDNLKVEIPERNREDRSFGSSYGELIS